MLARMWRRWIAQTLVVVRLQNGIATLKSSLAVPFKTENVDLPYNSVTALLGIYHRKMKDLFFTQEIANFLKIVNECS